jgi:hypothetical protein
VPTLGRYLRTGLLWGPEVFVKARSEATACAWRAISSHESAPCRFGHLPAYRFRR